MSIWGHRLGRQEAACYLSLFWIQANTLVREKEQMKERERSRMRGLRLKRERTQERVLQYVLMQL